MDDFDSSFYNNSNSTIYENPETPILEVLEQKEPKKAEQILNFTIIKLKDFIPE